MPPQVNAHLVTITQATAAAGDRDDWDNPGVEPAGAGDAKWSGDVAAYYAEKLVRVVVGDELRVFTARTVIIDSADYRTLALDTNDVVTIDGPAGAIQGRAVAIKVAELEGIPAGLQTTRIELEPAS